MSATRNCTIGRDLGDRRQPPEQQEGDEHRGDGHAERDEGERRAEHEEQHDERADAADHGLEQDAGAVVARARGVGQRVVAGEAHRGAADGRAAQRVAEMTLDVDVAAERVVAARREDVDERGAPVARGEGAVARGAEAGHARAGDGPARAVLEAAQLVADPGRGHGPALRQRHHRHQRQRLAAVAEGPLDLLAGLPAFATGHAEALVQRLGGRSGGDDADEGEQDPADGDESLVLQDTAGQALHHRARSPRGT